VAAELAQELREAAVWLGLDGVEPARRGICLQRWQLRCSTSQRDRSCGQQTEVARGRVGEQGNGQCGQG
jgi:hypothetical protein